MQVLGAVSLSGQGTLPSSSTGRFYYLRDHLGSVRATLNEEGAVVHYDDYYPFGMQMPNRSMATPEAPKERYSGKELDIESGLLYYGARYLDPVIARWNAVDPLLEKHPDWSPYNFVLGNPLLLVDPDGRQNVFYEAVTQHMPRDETGRPIGRDGRPFEIPKLSPLEQAIDDVAIGLTPGLGTGQDIYDARQGDPLAALGPLGDVVKFGVALAGVLGLARFADEAGELADAAKSLKQAKKGIRSLEKQIAKHKEKLESFRKDPDAHDNQRLLRNAPSEEIREKIIQGRVRKLEREIEKFKGEIQKLKDQINELERE